MLALALLAIAAVPTPAGRNPSAQELRIDCTLNDDSDAKKVSFLFPSRAARTSSNSKVPVLAKTYFRDGRIVTKKKLASSRPIPPFKVDNDHPPAYRKPITIGHGIEEMLWASDDGRSYTYKLTLVVGGLGYEPKTNVQTETFAPETTSAPCSLSIGPR